MRNYQIWNKHGDDSEKEPTEILMDTVEETIHYPITEVILVTMQENRRRGNETIWEILLADDVVDALNQTVPDGELDFHD